MLDLTVRLYPFLLPNVCVLAAAFIEGNSEPDGECLCRMQMVLSGPALHRHKANPSPPPSLCSSSSLSPLQVLLHNYLISSLLKRHLESEHSLRMGAGPFTLKPAFVSKCSFCSLHNYDSENAMPSPMSKKVAAI